MRVREEKEREGAKGKEKRTEESVEKKGLGAARDDGLLQWEIAKGKKGVRWKIGGTEGRTRPEA